MSNIQNFILIDGSYYNFYRFHSIIKWWKNAYPEDELNEPIENSIFVEKFRKTFVEHLANIPKKLKIHKTNNVMLVGKDCKRENIWRSKLYPQYKANRNYDGFKGGPFFQMVYEDNLFIEGGVKSILKHPELEADDCIAIITKYILDRYPSANIYIITNDRDYLQLVNERVHLYNLTFKKIEGNGNGNESDLFCKIVMGDVSDNIPSVFPKCGPKTALKYFNDKTLFETKLTSSPIYQSQYELNRKLVDFNCIPEHLISDFMTSSF